MHDIIVFEDGLIEDEKRRAKELEDGKPSYIPPVEEDPETVAELDILMGREPDDE